MSSHSPGVTWRSDPLEPGLSSVRTYSDRLTTRGDNSTELARLKLHQISLPNLISIPDTDPEILVRNDPPQFEQLYVVAIRKLGAPAMLARRHSIGLIARWQLRSQRTPPLLIGVGQHPLTNLAQGRSTNRFKRLCQLAGNTNLMCLSIDRQHVRQQIDYAMRGLVEYCRGAEALRDSSRFILAPRFAGRKPSKWKWCVGSPRHLTP